MEILYLLFPFFTCEGEASTCRGFRGDDKGTTVFSFCASYQFILDSLLCVLAVLGISFQPQVVCLFL